jgi:hypothetical protein
MATLRDLLPSIKSVAPLVPDFILQQNLVDIAREFFQETETWNANSEVLFLQGLDTLEVEAPKGADIYRVVWLTSDKRELTAIAERDFYTLPDAAGEPLRFAETLDGLRVHPTPLRTANGKVNAVYYPRTIDAAIPDKLIGIHRTTLTDGTIANLLMQNAEWGNASKGQYYYNRYKAGIERASRRAFRERGNVVGVTVYGGY